MNNPFKILLCIFCFFLTLQSLNSQCDQTVKLDGQIEVDAFLALNPDCEFIEELELTGDVIDVSGFINLKSLDYLYFADCPLLADISSFSNVDTIHENLGFYDEIGFSNLCGLSNLKYIGRDIRLEETSGIVSLTGLESLNTIGGDIEIFGNLDLESLDDLQSVISFGDDVNETHGIELTDNPKLNDCCGIQNLYTLFPQIDLKIENNAVNCNSIAEMESDDCSAEPMKCTLSMDNFSGNLISVFPNPCSDFVVINIPQNAELSNVELFNINGRILSKLNHQANRIDLINVDAGVYFLKMEVDHQVSTTKLIVIK